MSSCRPWRRTLLRAGFLSAMLPALLVALPSNGYEVAASTSAAQSSESVEQVVFGILSYSRWPSENGTLDVCIVGPTDHADRIGQSTSTVNGRPLRVVRKAVSDAGLGTDCDVAYLGNIDETGRTQVFSAIGSRPVLTISENDASCSVKSMFCLHVRNARVTFEINLDSVARSGIRVHPNVLKLARRQVQP